VTVPYYFLYAGVGKLFIYLFQIFPLADWVGEKYPTLKKLIECDLCLGVWMYFFVAMIMRANLFDSIPNPFGAIWIAIEYFMTGAVTSFIVHLVSLGWNSKFQIFEVN